MLALHLNGEQLIATQTRRNLERMRTILRNYNEVKQVEIEAKFLEVAQGDLEELGFDWSVSQPGNPDVFSTQGRNLSNAFAGNAIGSNITLTAPKQDYVTSRRGGGLLKLKQSMRPSQ